MTNTDRDHWPEDAKEEVKRLVTLATDRAYMMNAYRNMLEPKGLEVAKMWDKKGVTRTHQDWGPEAYKLTGEERAQVILEWEAAPRRRMTPEELRDL